MKEIILSFFIYSITGTLLHFTYNFFNKSIIAAVFSSVNESVWEHTKLLITPILILNTIKYLRGTNLNNYYFILFLELFLAIILIIFSGTIRNEIFNITSFYVISFIIALVPRIFINANIPSYINIISFFLSLIIFMMYLTFTIFPPKCNLFKDHNTNTYGLE